MLNLVSVALSATLVASIAASPTLAAVPLPNQAATRSVSVSVGGKGGATPSGIPFAELDHRIDDVVEQYLGESTPGVAVVAVSDGEIVFSKGWGYADLTTKTPIDPATTVFGWASTSKLFVWTSVMQLVEAGSIDLDADINIYLPAEFAAELDFAMPFTMRDLMNHTAGFGENMLNSVINAENLTAPIPLRDALLATKPLQIFQPGTVSAYSNFGTALAAYVVSQVSGQDFADYEMQHILAPAGMVDTLNAPHWLNNTEFLTNKATGYSPDGRGGFAPEIMPYMPLYPQGMLTGTAQDLARFATALTPAPGTSGPLFRDAATLQSLFQPSSLDPVNSPGTSNGFMTYTGALPAFGHGGDALGYTSSFVIVPQERFGFVILTNSAGMTDPTAERLDIRFDLEALLLGHPEFTDPKATNLPAASAVEGTYLRARSFAGNFLEFLDFISVPPITITAISDNTITATMGGFGTATYEQIEPYVFRQTATDSELVTRVLSDNLRFQMVNGHPVQIHIGNGNDFLPIGSFRSTGNLVASVIGIILAALFFIVAPIVLLIKWLRAPKRDSAKPSTFGKLSTALLLIGTMLLANNLIALVRILIINMFRSSAEMAPHIWINYILAAAGVVTFIFSLAEYLRQRKNATELNLPVIEPQNTSGSEVLGASQQLSGAVTKGTTAFYGATAVLFAALIAVLASWNFFTLI